MSLLTIHIWSVTVVLSLRTLSLMISCSSWLLMHNISLLTCQSCPVTLNQSLLTRHSITSHSWHIKFACHSWHITPYRSHLIVTSDHPLLTFHFSTVSLWPVSFDLSLLTCQSWLVLFTCHFSPVTFHLSLFTCHFSPVRLGILLYNTNLFVHLIS